MLLLASRRVGDTAQPAGPEPELGLERIRRLRLGPLSAGALHHFLRDRLGRAFARQTLLRIHDRSGGNPFFALELARVLDADVDPLAPLAVPETLEALLRSRIHGLPVPTLEALALASALGPTPESLLVRAGVDLGALDPAIAAHVIERESGVIQFTHPLLSSVLYGDLGEERWRIHERIASLVDEPLLRARHLALSSRAPDEEIAHVLEAAATLASDRGASAGAAELCEQAFRLTPPDRPGERRSRALAAARAHPLPENGRAQRRSRRACWPRPDPPRRASRRSFCSPRSRLSTARSYCSKRHWQRLPRFPRCRRTFTVASRGPPASKTAQIMHAWRSSSPRNWTTIYSGRTLAPCKRFSRGSPGKQRPSPINGGGCATSRPRSAATSWYKRRPWPS